MFNKKGQVTMFIILGIVLLAVIFAVFYFLGDKIIKQSETEIIFTESSVEPLKDYVEGCIKEHGDVVLELIGTHGDFNSNPGLGIMYHNEKINYLCYTEEHGPCFNRNPFLENYYETGISEYLSTELNSCIDLNFLRDEGYIVETGDLLVSTTIGEKVVIVTVDYPITMSKGETVIEETRFSKTFDIPLGKLLDATKDIIEYESDPESLPIMEFDVLNYNIRTLGEVEIEVDTIGDSRLYFISSRNNDYVYRFAVQKWVN